MFTKAVKSESKLRLAIAGASGSGKTYTALMIAQQFGKVAVVDTEHGSASKYSDVFNFDTAIMHPPFKPQKFCLAIAEAEKAGYDVVVLDSLSHAWAGAGGLLEMVDRFAAESKSGNSFMAWKQGTPIYNELVESILQSNIHVIATTRTKQEYVLQEDQNTRKLKPVKMGMAPIQRDGFEYEFDIVLSMDIENNATVTKTRCPVLAGAVIPQPGAELAGIIQNWLVGEKVENVTDNPV